MQVLAGLSKSLQQRIVHVADLQDLLQNLMDLVLVAAKPGFQTCILCLLLLMESVNPAAGCFRLLCLLLL